jgi:hypothetical protein
MTMFAAWQSYDAAIIPKAAPPVQHEECRRAFYAGAVAAYNLVMIACKAESDDAAEAQLYALGVEIRAINRPEG